MRSIQEWCAANKCCKNTGRTLNSMRSPLVSSDKFLSNKMKCLNRSILGVLVGWLLVASGCAPVNSGQMVPKITPSQIAPATVPPTAIPSLTSSPTATTVNTLIYSCSLLDSYDLASFFPGHAEVMLPEPQVTEVNRPIFSAGNASGTETTCVYYTFYLPGSKSQVVLQANYWLYVPASNAPAEAWPQDWTDAISQASQTIPDLGDGSFVKNGRLTFKKNDLYVTIEANETDLDLKTPAGLDKQIAIEKQIAQDMLERLR